MFPKDAQFICRRCLAEILFRAENFQKIKQIGYIGCPECGQRTEVSGHVSSFFEHYPFFMAFIPIMKLNGFEPVTFRVKEYQRTNGTVGRIISEFTFMCRECENIHTIDLLNLECWTDDLYCRGCGAQPTEEEYTRAFFHHLSELHGAQVNILEFQADIFHPPQLDPDGFPIRRAGL